MADQKIQYRKDLVSVIIPAYNSAAWIGRAIKSVLQQSYHEIEIIVVDDGSTDDTAEYVSTNYPDILLMKQSNKGVAAARNLGARNAQGDYIAFLDADDTWAPKKLATQLAVFEKCPDCAFCDTEAISFYSTGMAPVFEEPIEIFDCIMSIDMKILLERNIINTSSVLLRHEVFDHEGQFDETLRRTQDYDLWLRICQNWKVYHLNIPLIGYQITPGSLSSNTLGRGITLLQVFEKWVGQYPEWVRPNLVKYGLSVTRKLLRLGKVQEARQVYNKYYLGERQGNFAANIRFHTLKWICRIQRCLLSKQKVKEKDFS